jgi:hypothetical protein
MRPWMKRAILLVIASLSCVCAGWLIVAAGWGPQMNVVFSISSVFSTLVMLMKLRHRREIAKKASTDGVVRRPARPATWVNRRAVGLLSPTARAWYGEELEDELFIMGRGR